MDSFITFVQECKRRSRSPIGVTMKRWKKNLEAELEESVGNARLSSNGGSNAGVAVGQLRVPRSRSRGQGARGSAHTLRIVPGYREAKVGGPTPRATTRVA